MELVGSTFFFDWEVSLILWLQTHMGALGTAVASFVSAFGEDTLTVLSEHPGGTGLRGGDRLSVLVF